MNAIGPNELKDSDKLVLMREEDEFRSEDLTRPREGKKERKKEKELKNEVRKEKPKKDVPNKFFFMLV